MSPCDQLILVQTCNELVLVKWKKDSLDHFETKQEIGREQSKGEDIYSMDVSWNLQNKREHLLFVGVRKGKGFQAALRP